MNYTLSLTRAAAETLHAHLLSDRSREQMAVTLCGVNRLHHELRLLVRDVILLPADAFRRQSAAHLELKPEVQAFIHARAHRHGLIEVDWHSHPGSGPTLSFSSTDDHYEAAQAAYLAARMHGVPYGSVVVNDDAVDARLWLTDRAKPAASPGQPAAQPLQAILLGRPGPPIPVTAERPHRPTRLHLAHLHRQVFGADVQRRLAGLRIGVIGVGGLGSARQAHLPGWASRTALVDPDVVELTNLNRPLAAPRPPMRGGRGPRLRRPQHHPPGRAPGPRSAPLRRTSLTPQAARTKACDLLIVATDNHSSRMAANRLAVQYLIPLVHVGFNVSVDLTPPPSPHRRGRSSPSPMSAVSSPSRPGALVPAMRRHRRSSAAGWSCSAGHARSCTSARVTWRRYPGPGRRPSDGVGTPWPPPRSTTWSRPSSRSTAT